MSRCSTPRSFLEKYICHFFFCSRNGPFSTLFETLEEPKTAPNGLKMGWFHLLVHPNGPLSLLESAVLIPKRPISKAFWDFPWAKSRHHDLKMSRTYRGVRGQQKAVCHQEIKPHVLCSNHLPSFGQLEWIPVLFLGQERLF